MRTKSHKVNVKHRLYIMQLSHCVDIIYEHHGCNQTVQTLYTKNSILILMPSHPSRMHDTYISTLSAHNATKI